MKAYLILYSATYKVDYRFVAEPKQDFLPVEISNIFQKRIMGLLSYEKPINVPKWLIDKEVLSDKTYLLWGVSCLNSLLSSSFARDGVRRFINCFVGYIIEQPDESLRLPFDLDSFEQPFVKVMSMMWNTSDKSAINESVTVFNNSAEKYITYAENDNLNYEPSLCRVFQSSAISLECLFSEALSSHKTVSLASGIVNRGKEATNPALEPLLNIVIEKEGTDVKDVQVKHRCRKCKHDVVYLINGLCEDCHKQNMKPELQRCIACGQEYEYLYGGLCEDCYVKSKLVKCRKCGNLVERVGKDGKCDPCHTKDLKMFMFMFLAIILLCALIYIWIFLDFPYTKTIHHQEEPCLLDTLKNIIDSLKMI